MEANGGRVMELQEHVNALGEPLAEIQLKTHSGLNYYLHCIRELKEHANLGFEHILEDPP